MSNALEAQTAQNTKDIGDLTNDVKALTQTVTKVMTLVETDATRRVEDREVQRQLFDRLHELTTKVSGSAVLEEKLSALTRELLEFKADFRALRHDFGQVATAVQAIPKMDQRIGVLEAKVEALEGWRDTLKGGASTAKDLLKAFWAIFGLGVLAVGGWLLKSFFGGDTPSY